VIARLDDGLAYLQTWDAENRLAWVENLASGKVTTFLYPLASIRTGDGDGALVKKVASGETTVCVGSHYEKNVTAAEDTKCFYFKPLPGTGSQRVAMRRNGVLQYIAGAHPTAASLAYPAGLPGVAGQAWAARAWC
jgi:hypothetical protein